MLQGCLSTMLLRMGAVEAVLQARPVISGRYTDTPFTLLAGPLHPAMDAALAANIQVRHCSSFKPAPCTCTHACAQAHTHARGPGSGWGYDLTVPGNQL